MSKIIELNDYTESNGIYNAYFSGEYGTSLGMFIFKDGVVCGADLGGGVYDGTLEYSSSAKFLTGKISFNMRNGGTTITGAHADLPVSYETVVCLKTPLESVLFHEIDTLTGPVNVRFEKVRTL